MEALPAGDILSSHRQQLDILDLEMIVLIARRMRICEQIALLKAEHGIPMMQTERIRQVKENIRISAELHGLDKNFVSGIFDTIIAEACRIENESMINASMERTHSLDGH